MEKHEFGSPSWLRMTCSAAEQLITRSGVDLSGIDYVFGEEIVDLPARLNPDGANGVGWTVQIRDGIVSTRTLPPPEDADLVNVADWEAVEPLAHCITGEDPAQDEHMMQEAARLVAEGKLAQRVLRERPEILVPVLAPLHNAVVALTGPRQD